MNRIHSQSPSNARCPLCETEGMEIFYELRRVPVHSVLLLETREEALNYPRGDIRLGFCLACGFVWNLEFDASLQEYSEKYEATQAYSPVFNAFHRRLALSLIERYDLHGKRVVEIGCGQGEFLSLLCELGGNQGLGFDPALSPRRMNYRQPDSVVLVKDFYSDKYAGHEGDFICCKMTLEHIPDAVGLVRTIRGTVGHRAEPIVFFQVPNARHVFGHAAFWDVYYEHCSYFSPGTLARLFRRCGFQVLNLWTDFDDQYLMIEARSDRGLTHEPLPQEDDMAQFTRELERFGVEVPLRLAAWRRRIKCFQDAGRKLVLWGGGSKAVAFLSTLDISFQQIEYIVDVNPHKAGTYLAGTGQEIVAPDFLRSYRPSAVVVMNPVYSQEIRQTLADMDLYPEVLPVDGERRQASL